MCVQSRLHGLLAATAFALTACGGGGSGTATPAATTATVLTITESYNAAIKGDVDFSAATGDNKAETVLGGATICAVRLEKVKVAGSADQFTFNLYFNQGDKSVYFLGFIDNTNFLAYNMTTDSDAEKAKIKIDIATRTATFDNVLLKSNETATNKAKLNGSMTFVASTTAVCGT